MRFLCKFSFITWIRFIENFILPFLLVVQRTQCTIFILISLLWMFRLRISKELLNCFFVSSTEQASERSFLFFERTTIVISLCECLLSFAHNKMKLLTQTIVLLMMLFCCTKISSVRVRKALCIPCVRAFTNPKIRASIDAKLQLAPFATANGQNISYKQYLQRKLQFSFSLNLNCCQ